MNTYQEANQENPELENWYRDIQKKMLAREKLSERLSLATTIIGTINLCLVTYVYILN